jgi:hypothetical protein
MRAGTVGASVGGGGRGGRIQLISADYGTIGGGHGNSVNIGATAGTIAGGIENVVASGASLATIGGGQSNQITAQVVSGTIGGGSRNFIQANGSTIGGGGDNEIYTGAVDATIAGGDNNVIGPSSFAATIGGGIDNRISEEARRSTIVGGSANRVQNGAFDSSVLGGSFNTTDGWGATVAGGFQNRASGDFSFAAGRNAQALHDGAFVWSDSSPNAMTSTSSNQFLIAASGGVGINKNNPTAALDVAGETKTTSLSTDQLTVYRNWQAARITATTANQASYLEFNDLQGTRGLIGVDGTGFSGGFDAFSIATWSEDDIRFLTHQLLRMTISADGLVGIPTVEKTAKLNVEGRVRVHSLQITGGADIAEPFQLTETSDAEPGMVVSIDPDQPGHLRLSETAYDPAVAGVISGAGGVQPGMMLHPEGSVANGSHPVALTGRVYCWVDADGGGAVRPGDMLTTSGIRGHAMKATDRDRSFGTVLGKAMTSLESGRGLVLVLIRPH